MMRGVLFHSCTWQLSLNMLLLSSSQVSLSIHHTDSDGDEDEIQEPLKKRPAADMNGPMAYLSPARVRLLDLGGLMDTPSASPKSVQPKSFPKSSPKAKAKSKAKSTAVKSRAAPALKAPSRPSKSPKSKSRPSKPSPSTKASKLKAMKASPKNKKNVKKNGEKSSLKQTRGCVYSRGYHNCRNAGGNVKQVG